MTDYLSYQFEDTEATVSTFDELPLWSASFGLLLLKHLELKRGMAVLDLGPGTGFPLLELASRLGDSCPCYGLDTWTNANKRTRQKAADYGLTNVTVIDGSGEQIPLPDQSIDLIVSNLGINNFAQPDMVFKECYRVLKPAGRLALTTNLDGHWKTFYDIFEGALRACGQDHLLPKLYEHQAHRGTVQSITDLFARHDFKVIRHVEESFEMNFLDGTAFLNHHFVKLGWLSSWKELIPVAEQPGVFQQLELQLNAYALEHGSLRLRVPMAYMEGICQK